MRANDLTQVYSPRFRSARTLLLVLVSAVLSACSTGTAKVAEQGIIRADLLPQIGPKVAARDPNAAYQLSPDELKLDCKKLNGKMQVRLLQVRDQRERTLTSKTAQTMQSAVVPVLGGSPYGANPGDDLKRDKALLEAYNTQLAAKNCPTYNLENELQPRSIRDTPQPVPQADKPNTNGKTRN